MAAKKKMDSSSPNVRALMENRRDVSGNIAGVVMNRNVAQWAGSRPATLVDDMPTWFVTQSATQKTTTADAMS